MAATSADIGAELAAARPPLGKATLALIRRQPLGAVSGLLVIVMILMAVFAPEIAPYDPVQNFYQYMQMAPSSQFWLGTDQFGRDLLSRVMSGASSIIAVSLLGTLLGIVSGTLVGMSSGYKGGRTDEVVMRIMDGLMSFPGLLLALLVLPILLGSMWLARRGSLAGLLLWPGALFYALYAYVPYLVGAPFGGLHGDDHVVDECPEQFLAVAISRCRGVPDTRPFARQPRESGALVTRRGAVGALYIDVEGITAHAMGSSPGASAITAACGIALELERLTERDRGMIVNVGSWVIRRSAQEALLDVHGSTPP